MEEKKQKWWATLLGIVVLIIFSPIIVIVLLYFGIYYIIKSPSERRKYKKSGYSKYYPKYFFGISKSIHYRIYEAISEKFIKHLFISCDEGDLWFDEKLKEWVYITEDYVEHDSVDELSYNQLPPFLKMKAYGENHYPEEEKYYYICTDKKNKRTAEEQDGGLHGEMLEMFENDNRIIDISEILNYTD